MSFLDILDWISPADHAAIFNDTGIYADQALADAIAYGMSLGRMPEIRLPAGRLKFAQTVHLKHTVRLHGHGVGQAGTCATVLQFDADTAGFVVHRHNTVASGVESPPTTPADASVIEGVRLEGSGTVGHGVQMRARATLRECQINGFGEDGVHIVATAGSADPMREGNANGWILHVVRATNCGRHGLYLDGADVNTGWAIGFNAVSNGGWGVYDSGFLGNTYIACHASNNTLGPYKADNPNAPHIFDGCYSESGQPPSEIDFPSVAEGGQHAAGNIGSGMMIGRGEITPFKVKGNNSARDVEFRLGTHDGSGLDVLVDGDHAHGWSIGMWDETSGTVGVQHARLNGRSPIRLTTDLTTLKDMDGTPLPAGKMLLGKVLVHHSYSRYQEIDLLDLLQRIEALEAGS